METLKPPKSTTASPTFYLIIDHVNALLVQLEA